MSQVQLSIDEDGMVRVDGIPLFRILSNYEMNMSVVQFCDKDRLRAACRGERYVYLSVEEFLDQIRRLSQT